MARIAVVTGGAGFLGGHLVKLLVDGPHHDELPQFDQVRVLDLNAYDPAIAGTQASDKVVATQGSITDYETVSKVVSGATVVFHCAAMVDWGQRPHDILYKVNVTGTDNIIKACRQLDVKHLVYTSSMDVICWKGQGHLNARDEDVSIPPTTDQFLYGHYATTKATAEQHVLAANGPSLSTAVVRGTGMYGEGDPHHIPNVLQAAIDGQLIVRMGSPALRFQHTYVGNVAWLHVVTLAKLSRHPQTIGGHAFMAVDSPAENFWDFFEDYITEAGFWMPPAWLYLPSWLAYTIAYITVWACALLSPFVKIEPTITPGAIVGVLHNQSYEGNAARDILEFSPIFSRDESKIRTMRYMKDVVLPSLRNRKGR
eukprot:m.186126 g.186126  ORF g.186126 m.186126 type:complete len:369 (+) comp16918_c0_seq7:2909-4015(+)